ncbi:shikimate dehydrogenase [Fulvivirga sp. M361]|uniref:shikimate dehydrogenase family protein n=1 Tax=Fulvivirga sp. M361 TaxID=2594266 RepID=UPI00117ADBF1|nr:shikimate dehydrogenase [Fulvivirga sp. M361]TRX48199.1 shikimate dehydrogenase [Fulvivirga sp. M361]
MPIYGLIGKKLSHSFSKKFFTEKFQKEGLQDYRYELFELSEIGEVDELLKKGQLKGFNITIPYKKEIIPYLSHLDSSAKKVGAVNVVKIVEGQMHGYNSDYYGFKTSLENWLPAGQSFKALVLGTGGASKAVIATLNDMNICHTMVSRKKQAHTVTYDELTEDLIKNHRLIINTTPLGMSPDVESCPAIKYAALDTNHFLYDLVYNPTTTTFLDKGKKKGAFVKNGLEMLHLQADKSWEIWNKRIA